MSFLQHVYYPGQLGPISVRQSFCILCWQIIAEASRGVGALGDIALDDFNLLDGDCPRKCTWRWLVLSGPCMIGINEALHSFRIPPQKKSFRQVFSWVQSLGWFGCQGGQEGQFSIVFLFIYLFFLFIYLNDVCCFWHLTLCSCLFPVAFDTHSSFFFM